MSSTEIEYPVEVKQYQVSIARDAVRITLEGIEEIEVREQQHDVFKPKFKTVGYMMFSNYDLIGNRDFLTRDGILKMDRPLSMLSGVLNLLQHKKSLFLHKDGSLASASNFTYRIRA